MVNSPPQLLAGDSLGGQFVYKAGGNCKARPLSSAKETSRLLFGITEGRQTISHHWKHLWWAHHGFCLQSCAAYPETLWAEWWVSKMCLFFVTPEKNDLVRLELAVEQGCLWKINQFFSPCKVSWLLCWSSSHQAALSASAGTDWSSPHHPRLYSTSYHNQKGSCSLRRGFLSCHLHLGLGFDLLFVKLLH